MRHACVGPPILDMSCCTPPPLPVVIPKHVLLHMLHAGYSDLGEQLRKLHKQYSTVHDRVEQLETKLQQAQQQPPPNAWQAATFLLFFMVFINFIGMITTFNPYVFLPWMAKSPAVQSTLWLKQTLGVVVPITNTAVVLIFCLQAVKAAWTSLRW